MRKIGLTGGIGSGKTFVAEIFQELGAHLIDADQIARVVVEPGKPALDEIAAHFGNDVLLSDNTLDRTKLRKHIFTDTQEKRWLENLLHPLIREEIESQLNSPTKYYHLLVSPLLFETNQDELVSKVIVVDVPVDTQIARSCIRDHSSEADIRRIIDTQMPRQERLSRANHIIDNSGSKAATMSQVEQLHQKLMCL